MAVLTMMKTAIGEIDETGTTVFGIKRNGNSSWDMRRDMNTSETFEGTLEGMRARKNNET